MSTFPDHFPQNKLAVIALPHFQKIPHKPTQKLFGKQTWFFEDMVKSWPESPVKPFFHFPNSANLKSQKQETGYIFDGKTWHSHQQTKAPLHYFRAFSDDKPGNFLAQQCLKRICKPIDGDSMQNSCLNPEKMMDLLNHKPDFHAFLTKADLPTLPAIPINSKPEKLAFIKQNPPPFYLKPITGSRGLGIFKIIQHGSGFKAQASNGRIYIFNGKQDFLDFLNQGINSDHYFIQPEADYAPYHGRALDLRVLVQNRMGTYKVTGMGVRLGKKDLPTSNLSRGGIALPFSDLHDYYWNNYGAKIDQESESIQDLCLKASQLIAQETGEFLEIGFDILFTKTGPVILEANPKPSRWIFNVIGDQLKTESRDPDPWYAKRMESCKVPLEYAAWRLGLI